MLLIRALLVLYTLGWCVSVTACPHSCLMFFMSQCIVKASLTGTKAAIGYLQGFFRHCFRSNGCYSRLVWSKIMCISKICHKPEFVDCVDTRCSAILCLKKPFLVWNFLYLSKAAKCISTVYWCIGKRMREHFYWCAFVGFHCLLKAMYMGSLQAGVGIAIRGSAGAANDSNSCKCACLAQT